MVLWLLLSPLLTFSLGALPPDVPRRDRMIGGDFVEIEDAPYQVALLNADHSFVCGGAIIKHNLVITTKSCAIHSNYVRAGSKWHSKGGSIHTISNEGSNPSWGDLVALTVIPWFEWDETRKAIIVATQEPKPGDMVSSTGWGSSGVLTEKPEYSPMLQIITTAVISRDICSEQDHNTFCTIDLKKTQCTGDEGGPVVHKGMLVGIFKGVDPGCHLGRPALHINLVYYGISEWVANQTD